MAKVPKDACGPRAGGTGDGSIASPRWVTGYLHAGEAILVWFRLRTSGSK